VEYKYALIDFSPIGIVTKHFNTGEKPLQPGNNCTYFELADPPYWCAGAIPFRSL
jgi:hypothetical protein